MSANDLTNTFNIFLIISAIALPMPFGSLYAYRFFKKHFKFKQSPINDEVEIPNKTIGTLPKGFPRPIKKIQHNKLKIHHSLLLSLGLAKRKKNA